MKAHGRDYWEKYYDKMKHYPSWWARKCQKENYVQYCFKHQGSWKQNE